LPGAEDIFLFLKEKGVKVALNTGFSRNIADVIVNRLQWKDRGLIDDYIGSDEVPEGRPSADMIKALKKRLGISKESEVMKIGDTAVDVLEGRAAGCTYIVAVTTGAAAKEELEEHQPTHIIHHLNQIAFIFSESLQPSVQ
jgi:phosphonatase-like hydrolase